MNNICKQFRHLSTKEDLFQQSVNELELMQGKQNITNTERKGPHKSMHCKFCKPPGAAPPEKPSWAMLETKTKVHLTHEGADLRLSNVHDEPGYPNVESEACICMLEGENACPKCIPDKSRPPPKKKVCKCPKGAKPDLTKYNQKAPEKKKPVDVDDEFWWEKYSREHDALAKETWAAYMAQRRKDKKLEKCKKREEQALTEKQSKGSPTWYQKLSCQQMIYVEHLSTAIRLDSDENITERTHFILGGIGLYPRPKKNVLKKCLRYCHYNAIQFLNQLHILLKDEDPYQEKLMVHKNIPTYTWNEKLIMNSLCYLEFPGLLREIMDRLPPLYRPPILPQIPYPVIPKPPKIKYENPYEEPLWYDRINWVEKMKIERVNRCRLHMETKRVKIPPLALVRRPSLIDARPPFLAQIEANERASRRLVKEEKKKPLRKHPISTFNSAVDVTAIAGIEASEISTTDKADTDDICVFLRDPKGPESTEGEIEEEFSSKEVKFVEEPKKDCMKGFSECEECEEEGEKDLEDTMEFKTPPKTESGATIASPCPPPDATPGPPATHFEKGKRELDIINQEICGFFPFVSSSAHTVKEEPSQVEDVELNLKSAVEKLKKLAHEDEDEKPEKKTKKKSKCKGKKKRKCKKRKRSKRGSTIPVPSEQQESNIAGEEEDSYLEDPTKVDDDDDDDLDTKISFKNVEKYGKESDKRSQESDPDPDPDTEDEWSRPPCTSDADKSEIKVKSKSKKKCKRKKGKCPRRKSRKKKHSKEIGKPVKGTKTNSSIKDDSKGDKKEIMDGQGDKEDEEEKVEEFRGNVTPLVEDIVKDLAEEGYYCATYPCIAKHPDIDQLILHLKGVIMTKKLRKKLHAATKAMWAKDKGIEKFPIPDLGVPTKRTDRADWNDKKWISKLAKWKLNCFYYKVAKTRAEYAVSSYGMLYPAYFGSEKFIKVFYGYMPTKYEDCILRGIF